MPNYNYLDVNGATKDWHKKPTYVELESFEDKMVLETFVIDNGSPVQVDKVDIYK